MLLGIECFEKTYNKGIYFELYIVSICFDDVMCVSLS